MSTLLYIKASPRNERSHSVAVADAFVEAYHQAHPEDRVVVKELFKADLPSFDGFKLQAKYNILHGREHSVEEADAWKEVEQIIEEFTSADKYVFAVPMWNWSLPYPLKQYLDILLQPGYTFGADANGYHGLVSGKAFLAYSRGGSYPPGTERANINFQSPYLEFVLGPIMGLDIHGSVAVENSLGGPEALKASKEQAIKDALQLAKTF